MLPGAGRPAQDYVDLGNRVAAAGFKVVVVNYRGIGESRGPLAGMTQDSIAADAWAVADSLNLGKISIVGADGGNRIARTMSADRPNDVRSLTMLAAGGQVQPPAAIMKTFRTVYDQCLPRAQHIDAVRQTFIYPGHDPTPVIGGWNTTTVIYQNAAFTHPPKTAWANGGTAEALIVECRNDKIAPPINGWNFAMTRPKTRLVVLPACGHAMLSEQPVAFAALIISFLRHELVWP